MSTSSSKPEAETIQPSVLGGRPPGRSTRSIAVVLGLSLVAIAAGLVVFYGAPTGPVVGSDSVEAIAAARNFVGGEGLGLTAPSGRFMPLRLHPPLYPLLVSVLIRLPLDLFAAARALNAVLMSATVFFVGLGAFVVTRSAPFSVGIEVLLATSASFLVLFTTFLSEPLFLLLGVFAIGLLAAGAQRDRMLLVILAGLATGLASITRYPGLALAAAGSLFLLFFTRAPLRRRLVLALAYLLIATAPVAIWLVHLRLAYGETQGVVVSMEDLWARLAPVRIAIARLLWRWLPFGTLVPEPPYRVMIAAVGVVLGVCGFGVVLARRRSPIQASPLAPLAALLGLLAACYALLVAIAYVLRVPAPDLIDRTLIPIPLALSGAVLAVIVLAAEVWLRPEARRVLLPLGIAALIAVQIPGFVETMRTLVKENPGLTSEAWRSSCTLSAIDSLPPGLRLISNETAAVLLHKGVYPYEIPELERRTRRPLDERFGAGGDEAERLFRSGRAALVLFDSMIWDLDAIYHAEAGSRLQGMTSGLRVLADCADGKIYLAPSSP